LRGATTALHDTLAAVTAAQLDPLRVAMLALTYFGIAGAIPVSASGNTEDDRAALLLQGRSLEKEANSRLAKIAEANAPSQRPLPRRKRESSFTASACTKFSAKAFCCCQDLARMLMLEFAVAYGNDWFVVPLDLAVGSLCRITSRIVTDTFGVRTIIPPIAASTHPAAPSWRMFRPSTDRVDSFSLGSSAIQPDHFFLAPTLPRTLEGKPL
jgi:hypothetical protein